MLGRDLNQRDTIAGKHTVSGLLKLLYPNEENDKEAVWRCLEYALEAPRRQVKEQLKKIGGMEFFEEVSLRMVSFEVGQVPIARQRRHSEHVAG